jgi:outer membrane lipoprotein SlyB
MNIRNQLSILSFAVAAALPMTVPAVAVAQTGTSASDITISSLGVEQVRRLRPGNVLSFSLNGTPGSTVTLQIAGATRSLQLNEVRPGVYAGDYTIRSRDKLTAASRVTATLLKNGRTTTALLASSLLMGANDPAPVATAAISAFNVTSADGLRPGGELNFSVTGRPGGVARVKVQGVDQQIALAEVRRGVYEGTYVIRRQDRLQNELVADAFLLSDRRETSQRFERRVDLAANDGDRNGDRNGNRNSNRNDGRFVSGNDNRNDGRNGRQQAVIACSNCGAVESVNVVEVKSDSPNILGTIAGGLLGGAAGHQVGGGSGKDLATILGAVGGAYAGNRVQNNMGKTKVFRVTVRLEGGNTQDFDYADDPAVPIGTRVRVENGVLIRL